MQTSAPKNQNVNGLLRYFVGHKTAANLLLLLMLVAGVIGGLKIRAQFFPDVVIDTLNVSISWSGTGPQEVDEAIVSRLEPKLRAIDGIETITAVAREGSASFKLEFLPSWNMDSALDDVRAAIDEFTELPEDADEPVIRRSRWRDRVTDVVISGPSDMVLLERYAEELKNKLFKVGVTTTNLVGISDPIVRIDVDPTALERHKITLETVSSAISAETGTQAIGDIDDGSARIRAQARKADVQTINTIAIRSLPDGTKLRVSDVATVQEEGLDRETALYHNGKAAVLIEVQRDANGDAIKLQGKVEQVISEMAPTLPNGMDILLAHPRAKAISDRLDILIRNGVGGLVIVLAFLFLFLSARTAFWVAAGIPVAMAATVAMMYAFGFTFNMISLFALIICLGIVVDDAIVVGEHADQLSRQGLSPAEASAQAAHRMSLPVLSASVTTVIAFAGLVFIDGRFGRLISDLPFTVAVVILASLLESFLILPAHMRHALSAKKSDAWYDMPSRWVNRGFLAFRERAFRPFMRVVVTLRYPILAMAFLLLAVSVSAILDRTVKWRFFSSPERNTIRANIAMLPGANRADTKAMLDEMDRALKAANAKFSEKYGQAPVVLALAKVGGSTGRGLRGAETKDTDLLGGFDIELIDPDLRSYSAFTFIQAWRDEIKSSPMLETLALRGDRSGPGGDAIHVRLSGNDEKILKSAAEAIKLSLQRFPNATALEDDLAYDKPEYLVTLKPKGEALGFTTASIARALRQRLNGIEAAKLARGSREVKIEVRLPEKEIGPGYLHKVSLPVSGGGFVPLTEIASIEEIQGFSAIRRENGERIVNVTGDLGEDPTASAEVISALQEQILPEVASRFDVSWTLGGLAEQEKDFLTEATIGFALCLTAIYLVLVWIFSSWTRPLTIMLVIPFGLIGAVWGHYVHDVALSMFSIVGLIGMAGIIINDSIVLVTTIDERLPKQDYISAIVDGAADRLRAVLLTTLTTVGGLAPLLFEQSRQALFLKPTVITLGYGLGFGLVLVLLVTPAMVAIQHDISSRLKSARRLTQYWTMAKEKTT